MGNVFKSSGVAALLLGLVAAASAGAETGAPITEEARKEAQQIFATRCSTCHGVDGNGQGPTAAGFPVKPRNFTDKAWQGTVDDAHLARVIVEGGASVGKSPLMAPNPDLKAKPAVVNALAEKIRAFGK